MKLRDISGEINRAKTVYVWIWLAFIEGEEDDVGAWVAIEKKSARELVQFARDQELSELEAHTENGSLYFDEPGEVEADEGEEETGEEVDEDSQ